LPTRKVSQTLIRTITGILLALVFLACIYLGEVSSILFFLVAGVIACFEMAHALQATEIHCSPWPSSLLLIVLSAAALFDLPTTWSIIAIGIDVILVLSYALFKKVAYKDVLGTLAITLYPMLFFLLFINVGRMPRMHRLPIMGVVIIGASLCDIAAYFIGRFFGKHKMAPEISPKKTVEGSVAGIVFGTLSGIGTYWLMRALGIDLPIALFVIASFFCSVAGEVGDLCASMIKRQAGVKDYGKILPGHGGIMDRADSFVFAMPVALLCFELFFAFAV